MRHTEHPHTHSHKKKEAPQHKTPNPAEPSTMQTSFRRASARALHKYARPGFDAEIMHVFTAWAPAAAKCAHKAGRQANVRFKVRTKYPNTTRFSLEDLLVVVVG